MDLSGRLDQILQVRPKETESKFSSNTVSVHKVNTPCKEISEVHKLAVFLALNIDDTPSVFTPTNRLSIDDYIALWAHNGEGNHALWEV